MHPFCIRIAESVELLKGCTYNIFCYSCEGKDQTGAGADQENCGNLKVG